MCLHGRLARCICTTAAAVGAAPVGGDAARAVLPASPATAAIAAGLVVGVVGRRSRRCLGPSIHAYAALGDGALTCPRHQPRCPLRRPECSVDSGPPAPAPAPVPPPPPPLPLPPQAQLGGGANQELLLLVAALLVLFGLIGCLEFKPQDWLRGCTRCCARSYARGCACMARGCACVTRQRAPWRPFVGARRLSQESPSRRASRSPRKPEALRESRSPRRPSTPQGSHSSPRKPSRPHSWNPCGWLRRWLRGWRCCGSLRGWRCCGWLRGCTCPTLPLVGTRGLVGSSHAGRWHNHGLFIDGRGGGGGGSAGDRWRWRRPSPVASEGARAQYRQSDEALKHSQQALARSEQALSSAYRGARSLGARSLTPAGMPTLKPHTRVDRLAASSGRDFRPKSPKAQQKGRSKGRLSTVQL